MLPLSIMMSGRGASRCVIESATERDAEKVIELVRDYGFLWDE